MPIIQKIIWRWGDIYIFLLSYYMIFTISQNPSFSFFFAGNETKNRKWQVTVKRFLLKKICIFVYLTVCVQVINIASFLVMLFSFLLSLVKKWVIMFSCRSRSSIHKTSKPIDLSYMCVSFWHIYANEGKNVLGHIEWNIEVIKCD